MYAILARLTLGADLADRIPHSVSAGLHGFARAREGLGRERAGLEDDGAQHPGVPLAVVLVGRTAQQRTCMLRMQFDCCMRMSTIQIMFVQDSK